MIGLGIKAMKLDGKDPHKQLNDIAATMLADVVKSLLSLASMPQSLDMDYEQTEEFTDKVAESAAAMLSDVAKNVQEAMPPELQEIVRFGHVKGIVNTLLVKMTAEISNSTPPVTEAEYSMTMLTIKDSIENERLGDLFSGLNSSEMAVLADWLQNRKAKEEK